MFVNAVVSEIRELKEKKEKEKNSEIEYFKTRLCSSGHRASSLYQVSCLSVLWLVRYAS